jgi:hypothetical protein
MIEDCFLSSLKCEGVSADKVNLKHFYFSFSWGVLFNSVAIVSWGLAFVSSPILKFFRILLQRMYKVYRSMTEAP